jgi:acetate kinase
MKSIVVINCGSSSVKLDVFDDVVGENPWSGAVERVGTPQAMLKATHGETRSEKALPDADHAKAIAALLGMVNDAGFDVTAVGHRVVHGGTRFADSVVINADVVAAVEACVPLAPLHNPPNLKGIAAAQAALPSVPQVAVFDTAFHQSIPEAAWRYAIPKALADEHGLRRFGFHGTSHRYVTTRAAAFFARPVESLKLVTLHLGNGCSACAVDGGRSVDTSMGMTPLEGLVMGTRSGDVDPAIVLRLARDLGVDEAERVLNKASGLLGLSGTSQDMRDLVAAAEAGDADAAIAIKVFAHRAKKVIGAFAVVMGGLDAVVFTGGIGENSAHVRGEIAAGLRAVGALLHERKNKAPSSAERDLSTMDSRARLLVIPTDEERAIAQDVRRLITTEIAPSTGAPATP